MGYLFLCAVIASLLRKLESYYDFELYISSDEKKEITKLKHSLTSLLRVLQAKQLPNDQLKGIQDAVYDLDYSLSDHWNRLRDNISGCIFYFNREMQGLVLQGIEMHSPLSIEALKFCPHELELPNVKIPLHLAPFFTYCSLYPKGYRLVREILVNQWMAQGLLSSTRCTEVNEEELVNIGNRYFNELLSRRLLQQPDVAFGSNNLETVYSCEMCPLAHDVARLTAGKEVLFRDTSLDYSEEDIRYIAVHNVPPRLHLQNAIAGFFLRSMPLYKSWDRFIGPGFERLLVLDLSGSQVEYLPGLHRARQLRYLGLSRNAIIKRPWIGYCDKLETLALDGCVQLEMLTHYKEAYSLRHLRHLYLTTKQRTLSELCHINCLQVLELSHCKELRSLSDLSHVYFLRILRIFDCPGLVSLPDNMKFSIVIQELVLHNCPRLDFANVKDTNGLPRLKHLEIIGLPKLAQLPAWLQSATAMKYFMISNCKSLKTLTNVVQHLCSLMEFCIYDCPHLGDLPAGVLRLPNLQSLDIRQCPNLIKQGYSFKIGKPKSLDQEYLPNQMHTWNVEEHAAPPPQCVPYFILKSQTHQAGTHSEGILKHSASSIWRIFAVVQRATSTMRVMVRETYKKRDKMKLHCSLFPGSFEFERETLVQLWIAEGFLEGWNVHMEDTGNRHFGILLEEEYILPSPNNHLTGKSKYKINLCKVNAFLNGMPTIKEKDLYTILEGENATPNESMNYQHVSLVSNHIDLTTFETLKIFSKLRTLLFIGNHGSSFKQIPSSIFLALKFLKALHLSGSNITELPSSIGNMRQLSYLDLSFTLIKELPKSIRRLHKLQTLKLEGCNQLLGLPKETKELTSLRHLYFNIHGRITTMPRGIGVLTELRTLSAFIVNKENGSNIEELKNMNNLSGSCCISGLENASGEDAREAALSCKRRLSQLQLRWKDYELVGSGNQHAASETIYWLEPSKYLHELQILCFPGLKLPYWMGKKHFSKLVRVSLLKCENMELNISLGQLPELKYLDITQMSRVTTIDRRLMQRERTYYDNMYGNDIDGASFPKLEKLAIDCMHSLETWTGVQSGDFPLLSELSIKYCPKLSAIPFLQHLCSLKYLELTYCQLLESLSDKRLPTPLETLLIYKCPLLKKRCSKGGEDWHKIEHVPNICIDLKDIQSTPEDGADDNNSTADSLSEDDSDVSED